jgi:iron complex transport system permease protein
MSITFGNFIPISDRTGGRNREFFLLLLFCLILGAGGFFLSLFSGAAGLDFFTVIQALTRFNPRNAQHQVVYELRLPRTIMCVLTGSAFAVSGAIMQGVTRNLLADPGILGINAGSVLALAVVFSYFPQMPYSLITVCCFAGSAVSAGMVFAISVAGRGKASPVKLALAGSTLSAMLTAFSQGIAVYNRVNQSIAFWQAGGVSAGRWDQIFIILPWISLGLAGALVLSPSITVLSLGDEVAAGLGLKIKMVKLLSMMSVLMLAGASVSAAGNIAFLGLVVPHIVRFLVGSDYRRIIPGAILMGSTVMLFGDIAARMLHPPFETPVSVLLALMGVPFFLYLARKDGAEL